MYKQEMPDPRTVRFQVNLAGFAQLSRKSTSSSPSIPPPAGENECAHYCCTKISCRIITHPSINLNLFINQDPIIMGLKPATQPCQAPR
jgi:hypothetical protein